ncbi:hypothetical protein [Streptomyces marianii]|uniref:LPXTG cell wall anchor domain-containing protein n=1 Tax=Streptomyces marianii TaxID=1817406 RepID=A0A5R9E6N1_9ACTN|nr:hypothetical protein [Streptomyces marianii]TLQ45690.1 hypothetical protein FEF34_24240 [Streptomyces marianii]
MRSVPIALRVVGAAAGFLILAPVPGTAHAEEGARPPDTVHPVRAEPGSEVQDGRESGAVDRLQIVTLTPPSRFQPDDKQGEEENGKQDREGRDGKKDEGSRDGKKDDGKKDEGSRDGKKDDGKKDEGSRDGKKDDGKKDEGSRDGRKDDGSRDHGDGSDDGSHEGDGPEDLVEDPDPAESPVAPVRAGGGGAAERLAAQSAKSADTQGPGTPHTVIGLLLAGAAAVAVAFRSARRRRVGPPDRD